MTYARFRELVIEELTASPGGLTWKELRKRLELPCRKPCPEWVGRMERENGLVRTGRPGTAYIWKVDGTGGGI